MYVDFCIVQSESSQDIAITRSPESLLVSPGESHDQLPKPVQALAITQLGADRNQGKLLTFLFILALPPSLGSQASAGPSSGAATLIPPTLLVQLKQIMLEILIVNKLSASLSRVQPWNNTALCSAVPVWIVERLLRADKLSVNVTAAFLPTAHAMLRTCSVSGTRRRGLETPCTSCCECTGRLQPRR